MHKKYIVVIYCFFLSISKLFGQEQEPEIFKVFRGISLINIKTTENIPENGFNFTIQHRFGLADLQNEDYPLKDFTKIRTISEKARRYCKVKRITRDNDGFIRHVQVDDGVTPEGFIYFSGLVESWEYLKED